MFSENVDLKSYQINLIKLIIADIRVRIYVTVLALKCGNRMSVDEGEDQQWARSSSAKRKVLD